MIFFRIFFSICLAAGIFSLAACDYQSAPKGAIARVNGETINLRSAQALLDSNSASLLAAPRPSLAEMRQSYARAASILIANVLIEQELARLGLQVDERELEEFVQGVKDDYGGENFAAALMDASLREEDWRQFMKSHFARELFVKHVIAPGLRVPLAEIREYYDSHKSEFSRPGLYYVCYGSAEEKSSLEAWCKSGAENVFADSPLAQCMYVEPEQLPPPWGEEVKKIRPLQCGKLVRQDDQWRSVAVLKRQEAGQLPLSAAYALIENILLEQKKNDAFGQWLEKKLAEARIEAAPDLFPASESKSEF